MSVPVDHAPVATLAQRVTAAERVDFGARAARCLKPFKTHGALSARVVAGHRVPLVRTAGPELGTAAREAYVDLALRSREEQAHLYTILGLGLSHAYDAAAARAREACASSSA